MSFTKPSVRSAVMVRFSASWRCWIAFGARDEGEHGETGHHEEADRSCQRDRRKPLLPPRRLALAELVVGDAENSGEDLQLRRLLAIALLADVGGKRFGRSLPDQRRWQAFACGIGRMRLPVDDDQPDELFASGGDERFDFLVDPFRPCRIGRADDDQRGGLGKRFFHGRGKVRGSRQLVAVAEHRRQPLADSPHGAGRPHRRFGTL